MRCVFFSSSFLLRMPRLFNVCVKRDARFVFSAFPRRRYEFETRHTHKKTVVKEGWGTLCALLFVLLLLLFVRSSFCANGRRKRERERAFWKRSRLVVSSSIFFFLVLLLLLLLLLLKKKRRKYSSLFRAPLRVTHNSFIIILSVCTRMYIYIYTHSR